MLPMINVDNRSRKKFFAKRLPGRQGAKSVKSMTRIRVGKDAEKAKM
jgi:hypothetical protein